MLPAEDRAQAPLPVSVLCPQQSVFTLVQALLSLLLLLSETVVAAVERQDTDTGGLLQKRRTGEDEYNFQHLIISGFWKRKWVGWGSLR